MTTNSDIAGTLERLERLRVRGTPGPGSIFLDGAGDMALMRQAADDIERLAALISAQEEEIKALEGERDEARLLLDAERTRFDQIHDTLEDRAERAESALSSLREAATEAVAEYEGYYGRDHTRDSPLDRLSSVLSGLEGSAGAGASGRGAHPSPSEPPLSAGGRDV